MTLFDLDRAAAGEGAGPAAAESWRVAFGIAYDGLAFHGFAAQPGVPTVGGRLAAALGRIAGRRVDLVCAGRTDRGVHALAQVVHADLERSLLVGRYGATGAPFEDLPGLARALDRQLGPDAACWRVICVPPAFDARRSALARRYHYDLDVAPRPDPRRRGRAWRVGSPLDLPVMRLATDPVLGEHDFAAFCRRPPDRREGPLTRKVLEARWRSLDCGLLRLEIEGNAFCHQMVRSLVGAIVAAGRGRLRPSELVALLRSASRDGAPSPAPAHGLCLVAVRYPDELGGSWGEGGTRGA